MSFSWKYFRCLVCRRISTAEEYVGTEGKCPRCGSYAKEEY